MIEKIFSKDYLKRLDNLIQWSEKDVFQRESVSQHSYKVTIFCRVLLEEIFGKNKTQEQKDFLIRCVDHAMFHDWDEALLLRDISHETKYNPFNGKKIRSVLDDLSEYLANNEFIDIKSNCKTFIYKSLFEKDKNVLLFCKFCDWLALAFFIKREIDLGSHSLNKEIEVVNSGLSNSAFKCEKMFFKKFNINTKDIFVNLLKELKNE